MTLEITRHPNPLQPAERAERLVKLGFGDVFTDHQVVVHWDSERGWHGGELKPYGPWQVDPSMMVFHYGQAIFEGMKVYPQPGGELAAFRPHENADRFNRSAARLAMPEVPQELFMEAITELTKIDRLWVPEGEGQSLYLRPFMVASESCINVRPSEEFIFSVIACPVEPYFPGGVRPLTVWISHDYARAARGGTGAVKYAGNYGAGMVGQREAKQHGCDQVVWLDSAERRYVEEMGAMNLCFVVDGPIPRIVTPPLGGTLLPGVVRNSILQLAQDLGYETEEALVSADQWRTESEAGRIRETFACGTAAIIAPVGAVRSASADWAIGNGQPGPITLRLRQTLLDLQLGRAADPHGWMHQLT